MNTKVGRFICLLFTFFFCLQLNAQTTNLPLEGHLGKEEISQAKQMINQAAERLLIEVNSTSGDLNAVLTLAREIYTLKAEKGTEIIVYIDENALGAAAIIPFVADSLYSSHFVSWGDIPLGSENVLPTNILRNTVRSLINPKNPNINTLRLLAVAMSDPSIQLVDDKGWKIASGTFPEVISPPGETLVVNHNQLQELGLVKGVMSQEAFLAKYAIETTVSADEKTPFTQEKKELSFELKKHILFNPNEKNLIGLIEVNEKKSQISQATWIYVKHALDHYKKIKPRFVILELNTPGGEVFAAQRISDALKELDTQYKIPVVAFINNWAISAGAMLAYSSRFIAVTKDASMGAATPVIVGEGGQMQEASEKVNSALRADFANRAGFFDRDPDIAVAMVDKDVILVQRHGKIIKLDSEDQIRKTGPNPDTLISPKGKLLTLSSEEMMEYGVANLLLQPTKTEEVTEVERESGKWPASKMLLFQNPFFKEIPNAEIDLYIMDWRIQFLALLANPVVSSLLFLGMILGFYVEINTPGFGFPGSLALLCLFLIGLSSFALEVVDVLEVILLLVGVIFIAIDLFFIPTFGLLGLVGVVLFIIGLFGMMLPGIGSVDFEFDTQTFNAAGQAFIKRLAWLCGTMVVAVIAIILMGKYVMPSFKGFQRLVLSGEEETKEKGYFAGADPKTLPQPGTRGEVLATLRPAGKVIINGEIYDAITAGEYIEKGTPIEVVMLNGSVIIVDTIEEKE